MRKFHIDIHEKKTLGRVEDVHKLLLSSFFYVKYFFSNFHIMLDMLISMSCHLTLEKRERGKFL